MYSDSMFSVEMVIVAYGKDLRGLRIVAVGIFWLG